MIAIRKANATDSPLISEMIRELAEFEHELNQVDIAPEDLVRDGFGANPLFHALIAEWEGQPAGYALYYFTYSTWAGRPSIFVEDLFVREQLRGKGIGKALLRHIAVVGRDQNCYGMRWEVLNWNLPAIEFYRSLGAKIQDAWLPVLFMGSAFEKFVSQERQ